LIKENWTSLTTPLSKVTETHGFSNPYIYVLLPSLLYIIYIKYLTGISHIPGPFVASISNFWKIKAAWDEDMPRRNIALHRKYGPLVRIGPNMISVDDPSALNTIYGFKPIYLKVSPMLHHVGLNPF
jgi:hypothetical protein